LVSTQRSPVVGEPGVDVPTVILAAPVRNPVGALMTGDVSVLFVRVAVAARSVAFEVLSTFPSPTSPLTMPVGVLITGDVSVLLVRVFVLDTVGTTTPSTASTPAEERDRVVSVACPSSTEPTPRAVLVDAVMLETGRAVQFARLPDAGVPSTGEVRVGEVRVLFVRVSVVALPTSVSVVAGKVRTVAVPATADGWIVASPEVLPKNLSLPIVVAFTPSVIWLAPSDVIPATTLVSVVPAPRTTLLDVRDPPVAVTVPLPLEDAGG
jgi:hypothetical protein